jgi:hypothetical protein
MLDRGSNALYVGTGDAAVGTNPRNLDSLGGKVLRVHRRTGAPMPGYPFAEATSARRSPSRTGSFLQFHVRY